MLYDLHDTYGRYVASYGDHGSPHGSAQAVEGFIAYRSNLEKQTQEQYNRVTQFLASSEAGNIPVALKGEIAVANNAVLAALYNEDQIRWPDTVKDCLVWSRADATWNSRRKYKGYCLVWQDGLSSANTTLSALQREAGAFSVRAALEAEATSALAEQTAAGEEYARDVWRGPGSFLGFGDGTNKPPKTGLPDWVIVVGLLGGGLVAARVLLPALFGVYLADRRQGRLE